MAALTFAAVTGSLKAAADTVKSMMELRDATAFLTKANELQRQISAALADAISAYEAQTTQLQRIRELEEEVGKLKTWEAEKKRYELKNVGLAAIAYVLKIAERGTTPPHWACANCYEGGHIAIIQYVFEPKHGSVWKCPSCKNTIDPGTGVANWIN